MKALKIILGIIVGIVALFLIVALFVPKEYSTSTSVTINKPKQTLIEYMKMLKNQEQYSEWVKADLKNLPSISGIDGTVGATQTWKSEISGEGTQVISAITDDRINVDLHFKKPFEADAKASTIFKSVSDSVTQVTSEFYGKDKYPFNVMGYFIGKKMIEETELKNLQNVKQILEAQ